MAARTRNFATLLYPDSMPTDIWEKLDDLHIEIYVSPLHDKDIQKKTGELKKAHYHVVLCFEGKKSIEQVSAICKSFGGVGCEVIESKKSYLRYLCHLDSLDKTQYNPDQVKTFGGANYSPYFEEGNYSAGILKLRKEILHYIIIEREYSFARLVVYAMETSDDWLSFLMSKNGVSVKEFQKSLQWSDMQKITIDES